MSVSGKIEIAANSVTILTAAILSAVLIKVYLVPQKSVPQNTQRQQLAADTQIPDAVKVGDSLKAKLPGVDWQKNGRTLVLAISTQCHFCTDSAPFYRTLIARTGKNLKIVAVLPQPVETAKKYLNGEGVHVDRVEQLTLSRIGVLGTPTMLLADASGVVRNVWNGELQPIQQSQVLATLGNEAKL